MPITCEISQAKAESLESHCVCQVSGMAQLTKPTSAAAERTRDWEAVLEAM